MITSECNPQKIQEYEIKLWKQYGKQVIMKRMNCLLAFYIIIIPRLLIFVGICYVTMNLSWIILHYMIIMWKYGDQITHILTIVEIITVSCSVVNSLEIFGELSSAPLSRYFWRELGECSKYSATPSERRLLQKRPNNARTKITFLTYLQKLLKNVIDQNENFNMK